jgi:hypothetical protein
MRSAFLLHIFQPPSVGDVLQFDDESEAIVCQDIGDGWYLQSGEYRICKSGFDMNAFICAVLEENQSRQAAA